MSGKGNAPGNGRVAEILDRSLAGERLTDDDALVLLRTRDLVRVGRAADELRNRKVDPKRVTFIIDRNVNYTNICHTDCDFCAFYRRPGDRKEGYLLPKPVIFKKIEETLAIGGTALLMQGATTRTWASTSTRISSGRSRSATAFTCTPFRPGDPAHRPPVEAHDPGDAHAPAGRASTPCRGGAEILVDRVRDIIARRRRSRPNGSGSCGTPSPSASPEAATCMSGRRDARAIGAHADPASRTRPAASAPSSRGRSNRPARLAGKVSDHPTSFDYLLTQAVSRVCLDWRRPSSRAG